MDYAWAANKLKLRIAEQKVKQFQAESGKELNEENIKEWYIKLGGLVIEQPKKVGRPANVNKTTSVAPEAPKDKIVL